MIGERRTTRDQDKENQSCRLREVVGNVVILKDRKTVSMN